ncbi:MAG: response regulator transcription factor [Candidatus Melainabacteria bacterium]|nr:MAG: response regulator transcription factor [Candidatus Melainabacteria bacterium]
MDLVFCKMIKEIPDFSSIQIIMLTARKMEEDILQGFENGAIDYISKPFNNKILLARIKAHLKNTELTSYIQIYKNIELNNKKKIAKIDDKEVNLTKFEYILLQKFISNPGIVFSRTQLLSYLRGDDGFNISERAIDFQIVNLQKKLGAYGASIETVRVFGYKLKRGIIMKKREFFWLSKLLLALIIILFFSFIALNNIFQFNTSYMQEEKEELQIFKRQISGQLFHF